MYISLCLGGSVGFGLDVCLFLYDLFGFRVFRYRVRRWVSLRRPRKKKTRAILEPRNCRKGLDEGEFISLFPLISQAIPPSPPPSPAPEKWRNGREMKWYVGERKRVPRRTLTRVAGSGYNLRLLVPFRTSSFADFLSPTRL